MIVGVEQGAQIADRLLRTEIDPNPGLVRKLAAAYLIDAVIPAAAYGAGAPVPACSQRAQTHCVVAWAQADEADPVGARLMLNRALVWMPNWTLDNLANGQPVLCVNPLLGQVSDEEAPARLNLGAAKRLGTGMGRPCGLPAAAGLGPMPGGRAARVASAVRFAAAR